MDDDEMRDVLILRVFELEDEIEKGTDLIDCQMAWLEELLERQNARRAECAAVRKMLSEITERTFRKWGIM